MNIIIPMAGRGTRLRPHTLTTPKPLIKLAGKTIVQRLLKKYLLHLRKQLIILDLLLEILALRWKKT